MINLQRAFAPSSHPVFEPATQRDALYLPSEPNQTRDIKLASSCKQFDNGSARICEVAELHASIKGNLEKNETKNDRPVPPGSSGTRTGCGCEALVVVQQTVNLPRNAYMRLGHATVPYLYGNTALKTVTSLYRRRDWLDIEQYGIGRIRVPVTGRLRVVYGYTTVHAISSEINLPTIPGGCRDALPPQTSSPSTGSSVYALPT
ncbi:hypothetical protein DFH09DRAFT_1112720 [Mycena vulgaris]|nr:hypothetical protein DFH09DRAFT_1112720 [Mycena vulgaris]